MNKNKMFIGSLLLVVILIGCLSYSICTITKTQEEENIFYTGCFDISFTDDTTQIEITDAYPLSTKEGMKQILSDIQDGTFKKDFADENATDAANLKEMRAAAQKEDIEIVGERLRKACGLQEDDE